MNVWREQESTDQFSIFEMWAMSGPSRCRMVRNMSDGPSFHIIWDMKPEKMCCNAGAPFVFAIGAMSGKPFRFFFLRSGLSSPVSVA